MTPIFTIGTWNSSRSPPITRRAWAIPRRSSAKSHHGRSGAIFRDGIRLQSLMGFFRPPDVTYESTGHPARQIRVTGYLLWDDEHNGTADVGPRIQDVSANKYHHPWRSTAWEIHPVVKIETMDGPLPPTGPAVPPLRPHRNCAAPCVAPAVRTTAGADRTDASAVHHDYAAGEDPDRLRRSGPAHPE